MSRREPGWWYARSPDQWSALTLALAPFGAIYGAAAALRLGAPARYRARLPVVAVGNFTAGGTGKTPFVRAMVAALRAQGHSPVVLSRGYGGRCRGPCRVDRDRHTALEVGDEPLMLAADMPVVVARDRAAGARAIEAGAGGAEAATVIVMDDGMQNPSLAKDLVIAVVDAIRGVGNGRCIPAGPLRAPLATQIGRVDALLLTRSGESAELAPSVSALTRRFGGPILRSRIVPANGDAGLAGRPVVAFAGIGAPERFFATLEATGARIVERVAFGDHHAYSAADAARLLALSDDAKADLVTTEKDRARLAGLGGELGRLRERARVLSVRLLLDDGDMARLGRMLAERVPLKAGSPA